MKGKLFGRFRGQEPKGLPQEATRQRRSRWIRTNNQSMKTTTDTVPIVRRRRRHDETFKREAVELSRKGDRGIGELARELGVREGTLYRWRQIYAASSVPAKSTNVSGALLERDQEIRRLRAELIRMQERETILKKSLGILSETPVRGMPRSKP